MGVPLFSRGRHGAVLTPAGERVLGHARQALHSLEQMQQEADLYKGLQGGRIRIAALLNDGMISSDSERKIRVSSHRFIPLISNARIASFRSVATHLLPKIMVQFRDRYPAVNVTILERPDYLDIEQCVREGRAEIGITYLPTSEEFEAWELLRDEYLVLLPPKTNINSDRLAWDDLAAYSLVMLPCLPCGRILHQHLKTSAPPLPFASDIQEDSTIISIVMQGLGAAILPKLAAEPIPELLQIHPLPVPLARVIGVAVLADALHIPAVYAFLEVLKQFDLKTLATMPSR